jgi:SGNH domain-containing protein
VVVRGLSVAALLAMGVWSSQAIAGGGIQTSATHVRPKPRHANADRGQAYKDGCHVEKAATRSPPCVYGDPHAATTVVLFGDSHALHFFPALEKVAEHRDWRLVSLTKSGCPPADVDVYYRREHRFYSECGQWRENTLRRIEEQEKPALVITSASIYTGVMENGKVLSGLEARTTLGRGYAAVLERLVSGGMRVVAIRDVPRVPGSIPKCVAQNMRHLRRCAFSKHDGLPHPDAVRTAVRGVAGVRLIDATSRLCVGRLCPAVIDDVLVYRDQGHLTATFAARLAPWLTRKLRDLP